ncbi:MAG: hypothetical protein CVV47_12490 [Spirochaetae bacterium HGW-Spirochaetae-3]|jgi:uncharacterized damage-inducible protein DinB|nr:MAG: hypothetical protein CVV47_12490 [Spirochaetae bacterium HGW-Spirochaetae-3]
MKAILESVAEYNAAAMDAMLAAIAKAPAGLAARDVGLYYKSVDGTVEHLAWALVLWLKRYAGFGSYHCLASSALIAKPLDETRDGVRGDSEKTAALLREADALMIEFVKEVPESELSRRVTYRTTDGKEFSRTFWHTIFQVLNHGTHHRGEISAILDMNGVANDFNGFTSYLY